jgi:two-component system, cell cycle response regulator DivK
MPARILIIEDNPTNLELMSFLLGAHGHTVLSAHDGESGIELARSERPDLILCDVQLPRLDGYGVVRLLKSEAASRSIPLIAVTAFAMVGDRDKMLAAGFDGYLPKPITPETFVGEVDLYLPAQLRSTSLRAGNG